MRINVAVIVERESVQHSMAFGFSHQLKLIAKQFQEE
jgi:hypothetical protein